MGSGATFSTESLPGPARAAAWARAVSRSYFPLDLEYRQPQRFAGSLHSWALGDVQASRLASEPAQYSRRRDHLRAGGDEDFLLTLPRAGPVRFLQMGREVRCAPGGFLLERGNEPYVFSYDSANTLIVAKISGRDLAARLADPGRYCALCFDGETGVGGLLQDLIRASEARAPQMSQTAQHLVGQQVIDLLALTVEGDPRVMGSGETSVRRAHLRRIESVIGARHGAPGLSPGEVAAACGISLRYLHDLCRSDGATFGERLRRTRLDAARAALLRRADSRSITQIAFAAGFADASSFSRAYRRAYDETPKDTRGRSNPSAPTPSEPDSW